MTRCCALSLLSGLTLSILSGWCPPVDSSEGLPPTASMGVMAATDPPADTPATARTPVVQIAILLDTSNSMDGLIAQAKSQLWSIVNTLATAKHKGVRPGLRVALYEYGKSSLPRGEGFMRQVLPLTSDLDEVSAQLFALTTNGGDEFCGQVIGSAAGGLAWSENPDDLKFILIAGNEPFTQGSVDYRASVPEAVKRGIIVNTIHCGDERTGIDTGWKDGAVLGEGAYSFIDTNAAAVHIPSPFDGDITRLSGTLNDTYIAYGAAGREMAERQVEQDSNAAAVAPGAAVQRAQTKAGLMYRNDAWDLVDGVKSKQVRLADLKDEELPEVMRSMTPAEREAYVKRMEDRRAAVQKEIGELNTKREAFVAAERAKQTGSSARTLQDAVLDAIRSQANARGYVFEKP